MERNVDVQNAMRFLHKMISFEEQIHPEMKHKAQYLIEEYNSCESTDEFIKFMINVNEYNAWIYENCGSGVGM